MSTISKPQLFTSKILEIKEFSETNWHFILSVPEGFSFSSGQFVSLIFKNKNTGEEERRPYSICSNQKLAKEKNQIEIIIKKIPNGLASEIFFNSKVGDELTFMGPMGRFTLEENKKGLFLISVGTGIAPFRSAIPALLSDSEEIIHLLAGYKNKKESIYDKEFKLLQKQNKNFSYQLTLSQEENKQRVTSILNDLILDNFEGDFYICGMNEMVDEIKVILENKGISKERVHFEKWGSVEY